MAGTDRHSTETLAWSVGGMDCASCATKIRGALERMPGVSDVAVSVMTERLTLRLEPGATAPEAVERMVRGLGFTVTPGPAPAAPRDPHPAPPQAAAQDHAPAHDHDHDHPHAHGQEPSHGHSHDHGPASGKMRLVALTGALLALAWALHFILPGRQSAWAFAAACLIGLAPVARRAVAAARAGQPFTIEMLMTIAAVGAVLIGATEEAATVVFLFLVGELLEGVAAGRARKSIQDLTTLVPKTALLESDGGQTREVPAETLAVGSVILVRPGDRIPADGEIIRGLASVNEAAVTGESAPVLREAGTDRSSVIGGTKVIPQLLRDTRKLLADEWAAQDGKAQQP